MNAEADFGELAFSAASLVLHVFTETVLRGSEGDGAPEVCTVSTPPTAEVRALRPSAHTSVVPPGVGAQRSGASALGARPLG